VRVARRSPIMLPWCGPGVVSRHARTTHPLLIGTSALSTAETAARELGTLTLSDALSLCRLYERDRDPWLERAIRRWISRMRRECALRHEQVGLLVVAARPPRTEFRQLALNCSSPPPANCVEPRRRYEEVGPCASGASPRAWPKTRPL
jgi:hypothetical protein